MLLMLLLRSLLSISDFLFVSFCGLIRVSSLRVLDVGDVSLPCENGYDICMEDCLAFCFCFCLLLIW